jgi:ADP-L-glycero-D-manno-heptose 6-epimerase
MKILLTGYKGFIGSHMLTALSEHEVSTYEWGEKVPNIQGLDWIIHIGAISSTTEHDVNKIMRQNYDFSCWILDECIGHKVNLQYSSSASIYGLGQDFNENAAPDPRTPYAWSKYMFERYTEKNKIYPIYVQGFRYFNVYGDGEEHKGTQASPFTQFRLQAERVGEIRVFEDSENYHRDFVPVSTVIDIHKKFLNIPESGIWNIGTGSTKSFLEVAQGFDVPIVKIPMPEKLKASYQAYTCADTAKVHATLAKYL